MPEGDTITKLARFLHQVLAGKAVRAVRLHPAFGQSMGPSRLEAAKAHGKHLYLWFASGWVLRTHLGLYGSWHRYRRGELWRRPRRQLSILIEASDWDYLCFNAKEVEWLEQSCFRLADQQHHLGGDLIAEPLDALELLRRARQTLAPETLLVDALLDQRLAAGIGNVYKSELLFLERRAPLTRLNAVSDEALLRLYRRAADLLNANLGGGARRTRFEPDRHGRLWVYGRLGRPCLRCGMLVRRAVIGARPRSTYWCERCQSSADAALVSE